MKGRWAAGIEPRDFRWIYRGALAISERPGGAATSYRQVRRDEELLWLKHQGFSRVISIDQTNGPTELYRDYGLALSHYPLRHDARQREILGACLSEVDRCFEHGQTVLLHADDVSDYLLGLVAGYLVWSGRVSSVPPAIAVVERLLHRSIGPSGRSLMSELPENPARPRSEL